MTKMRGGPPRRAPWRRAGGAARLALLCATLFSLLLLLPTATAKSAVAAGAAAESEGSEGSKSEEVPAVDGAAPPAPAEGEAEEEAPSTSLPADHLPAPSTIECTMLPDGLDICVYTNVCMDPPQPRTAQQRLLFLAPVGANPKQWRYNGDPATPFKRAPATGKDRPTVKYLGGLSNARTARATAPNAPHSIEDFDLTYKDLSRLDVAFSGRLVPLLHDESRMSVSVMRPSTAVPSRFGGDFAGTVAWVDSLYVANAFWVHNGHLWGTSASIIHPLLSAYASNRTMRLELPPLENVMVLNTRLSSSSARSTWSGRSKRFVSGLFHSLMMYMTGQEPWQGAPEVRKKPKGRGGAYPNVVDGGGGARPRGGRAKRPPPASPGGTGTCFWTAPPPPQKACA